MSISNYAEDELLKLVVEKVTHVKLHIGDPGEAGTANAAATTARKAVTLGAPSSGASSNTNKQLWEELTATETISHVSLWDNESAGNCWWTGPLEEAIEVIEGGNFEIGIGDLIATLD